MLGLDGFVCLLLLCSFDSAVFRLDIRLSTLENKSLKDKAVEQALFQGDKSVTTVAAGEGVVKCAIYRHCISRIYNGWRGFDGGLT